MKAETIAQPPTSPSSLSSSVHPEETSRSFPPQGTYRASLDRLDPEETTATEDMLALIYPDPDGTTRVRLRSCRQRAFFIRNIDTGEVRISANTCRSRWCLPCAKARATTIGINVEAWIRTVRAPKLLTLTLQHQDTPLAAQLKHLTVYFARLRKKPLFAKAWRGGLWFIQVTRNDDSCQWHPHLHVILDGDYVPQRSIAAAWQNVTTTSRIVDIRKIRTPEYASRYVSRYVSRPMPLKDLPVNERTELFFAFAGKRLVGTFGTAKGARLLDKPSFDSSRWKTVGTWFWVTSLASTDPRASEIWDCYWSRRPLSAHITLFDSYADPDRLPPALEPEPPPTQRTLDYGHHHTTTP